MKNNKKTTGIIAGLLLLIVVLVAAVIALFAVRGKKESTEGSTETIDTAGKHHIEIQVKDYGTIKAELDGDAAPITVANFLKLAESGFYDGLTFHRIIDGFMIQGGDPKGNGTGGADKTIKGEFSQNGVENKLSHVRGTLSMARSQDMDSASSQFFIVQSDCTYLDGQYAAFGTVTEGMELVDKICKDTPVQDNNGTVSAADQPVIESIKVID
ncbi:peptidylprolyl isomerase [Blautia sp. OF03-15BH]|uniref:peptidylprolyl isomerase n=1 Tax=Blautia sp. OF03-15BH TaxID=2292287 RepID=UPI000E553E1C|nr:peptidylprolyl isomerase [Blautia sp. OF03-15BH]RGY00722.1 peptidylprolyl isomerase [Blautia sp. OF03-15BH]